MIGNWKWLASSGGVIAAVGTFILKGPEIIESGSRTYRKVRGIPETPYPVSSEAFGTDSIPRFGFKFAYPMRWDRSDPDNSDGSCYRNPRYPLVTVVAYGSNPVLEPTTLEGWVEAALEGPHRKLLSKVESGRYLVGGSRTWRVREKVPGVRAVYEYKDRKTTYRVMAQFVQHDAQVCVLCSAPKYLFGSFEQMFLHVCDSLELYEPIWSISNEQKNRRRDVIWEIMKAMRPTEAAKTSGLYACLMSVRPALALQITEQELEVELREMEKLGLVYRDPVAGGWSCHKADGN
jgi:hypothetical protein